MKTKPKLEESLHLPSDDALEQALTFLQNSSTIEEVKLKDIRKAVKCIEEDNNKEEENLLPENISSDLEEEKKPSPLDKVPEEEDSDNEDDIEFNSDDDDKEDKNPELKDILSNISSEANNELEELKEEEHQYSKLNLPSDRDFNKSMDDTIEKSLYAFRELFDYAVNASSGQAVAEIASASQSFLKLAFDARQAKLKHKLDIHKANIDERKVRLQEAKVFTDLKANIDDTSITSNETTTGIKMTPSLREQLLKENAPENNK